MSDQTDREARYAEAASKHRETASYRQGVYACTCGRRFAVAEGSWLGSLMEHVRDENARAVLALADAEQAALRALADVLGQDYERAVAEQAPLRAEVERLNNLVRFYSQQYEASAEREQDAQEKLRAVEALFAGGPDTACRTVWDGDIECVSVPMVDLRRVLRTARRGEPT